MLNKFKIIIRESKYVEKEKKENIATIVWRRKSAYNHHTYY